MLDPTLAEVALQIDVSPATLRPWVAAEIVPLRSFLLAYRVDPAFSTQIGPLRAAIDVLIHNGQASEVELVAYIARDERTQPAVAEYAVQALSRMEKPDVEASGDAGTTAK